MRKFLATIKPSVFLAASFFVALFFLSSATSAQTVRPTTFDNRGICEDSKGVWRQFGNGCADECRAKFDRFNICTQSLVYACECGKGRCWNDSACVTIKDYKKIYDAEQVEEKKILEAAKEKRKAAALANQEAIMLKLVPPPPVDPAALPAVTPAQAQALETAPTSPITQVPGTPAPPVVVKTPEVAPPVEVEIPPFLLKKQAQAAAQQEKTQESKPETTKSDSIPPGLPEIPLPN